MKDHLRDYFPDRFEDSGVASLGRKALGLLDNLRNMRIQHTCEKKVLRVFESSDELRLLTGAMKKFGCNFNILRHVVCEKCNNCHGGFDPDTKQIIVCSNRFMTKDMVMATIMHEMIHMFDYCRAKFDFNNLDHVACSEIRAANLTYCGLRDRLAHGGPGMFDLKKTHQFCVKDVAFQSVKAYSPETSDEETWKIIDRVFPGCYNDLEPFGRRPTSPRDLKQSYRERYYYGYV